MSKISIIMPTYNRDYIIGMAIESVLSQTYEDFELIIIDDGSIDKSAEVVKSYNDLRILYRAFGHKGVSSARNKGLSLAQGLYIAYLDTDCIWRPNFLEVMKDALDDDLEVGMFYSSYELVYQTLQCGRWKDANRMIKRRSYDYKRLLRGNFIELSTVMHRKSCIEKIGGFDESLDCLVDWDFFIRMGKEYRIESIDQPLVICYYREDGDNLTFNVDPLPSRLHVMEKIRKMGHPIYTLLVDDTPDGGYKAYLPDVNGYQGYGRTRDEAIMDIKERLKNTKGLFTKDGSVEFVILNR